MTTSTLDDLRRDIDRVDEVLVRLLNEVEQIRYIKEEASPSAHHVSAVVKAAGDKCDGIFGGAFGRWMLSELRRGARGFMPAAEIIDVYVQVWDAFERGDEATARRRRRRCATRRRRAPAATSTNMRRRRCSAKDRSMRR